MTGKCLMYEVKCTMCGDFHISNIKQTFKKIMDVHFSNVQPILINGQNYTHLLPTMSKTSNLLPNALTYLIV